MSKWAFYHIPLLRPGQEVTFTVHETNGGVLHDCDLYVQVGTYPTRRDYFDRDASMRSDSVVRINSTTPRGVWYAGVYGFLGCSYNLNVSTPTVNCPNGCSGHGSCNSDGVCACNANFGGPDCSWSNRSLTDGVLVNAQVDHNAWSYFYHDLTETKEKMIFTMDADHDCDLYVRHTDVPSLFVFDAVNATTPEPGQRDHSTVLLEDPDLGRWYVGVYGFASCAFSIKVEHTIFAGTVCANNCSTHGTCVQGVCQCEAHHSGDVCESYDVPLAVGGDRHQGYVDANQWNYYTVHANGNAELSVIVHQLNASGDCDLYAKQGARPNRTDFDLADLGSSADMQMNITDAGEDVWYLGVYGWVACSYQISITEPTLTVACGAHGHPDATTNDSCVCDSNYYGDSCNVAPVAITPGNTAVTGTVASGEWKYYSLNASSVSYTIVMQETAGAPGGDVWLFVQNGDVPTDRDFAASDVSRKPMHYVHVEYPTAESRFLIIGVFGSPFAGEANSIAFKISSFAFPSIRTL
jgi:hypothetical protein